MRMLVPSSCVAPFGLKIAASAPSLHANDGARGWFGDRELVAHLGQDELRPPGDDAGHRATRAAVVHEQVARRQQVVVRDPGDPCRAHQRSR